MNKIGGLQNQLCTTPVFSSSPSWPGTTLETAGKEAAHTPALV